MRLFRKFRNKIKHRSHIKRIFASNNIHIAQCDIDRIVFNISGNNNDITIGKLDDRACGKIYLNNTGENNHVNIGASMIIGSRLNIIIGQAHPNFGPVSNVDCNIGENTSIESCTITTYNSNAKISVGPDCMFSSNVNLFQTDAHAILDAFGNIINKVKSLEIEKHVWLGANVTILKNTHIPMNSIVGWGAVVCGNFIESGLILAGNPAKIVHAGISWRRNGSLDYVKNEQDA